MATTLKLGRRLVSLAPAIPTPTASSLTRIFRATPTVRRDAALPDQELSVFGSFTATTVFALDYPGLLVPLVLAVAGVGTGVAQRTSTFATLVVPDSVPMERLRVWPIDMATAYAPAYVNRATPTHTDSDRFSPGYGGVLHGWNMRFAAGGSKVRLKDAATGAELTTAVVDGTKSADKYLYFTYPTDAVVGHTYQVGVSNGYGSDEVVYLPDTVSCLAGCPDYFNLAQHNVSHRAIFNFGDKVYPITTANATDDVSAAVQSALFAASGYTSADGRRGGVVELQSNCVLTDVTLQDYTILRWAAGVKSTSPTGSDPNGTKTPVIAPAKKCCGIVGFNHQNLADTSTATPYRNFVAYGGSDLLLANGTWDMGEGRWCEAGTQNGVVIVGCTFHQGPAVNANPQRGCVVLDGGSKIIWGENTMNFAIDCVSMLFTTNVSVRNSIWNWDYAAGNPYLSANHSLAIGGVKNAAVFNNTFNLVGTKDMYGQKLAQQGKDKLTNYANDSEQIIAEITQNGNYYHSDFVTASTSTSFTGPDLSNTVGYVVRIVDGTGLAQERTITALNGNTATVDRAWYVLPDSTSRYVTDRLAVDNLSVSDCTFFHGKRGILIYLSSTRNCHFTNNTFPNGSGIDCSPLSSKGAIRPMWDTFIDGNTLDSSTDTANATRIGMHTVITDTVTPQALLACNTTVRRNAVSASDPSLKVVIDAVFGSGIDLGVTYQGFGYGQYQPSATLPVQCGFIVANNSVRQCAFGVRTTQGTAGVYVRGLRTQGNTTTHLDELYQGNTVGALNYLETGTAAFTGAAVAGIGQVTS